MTSDVTLSGALNNVQKTQNQTVGLAKDFTQFLTLLTTQLQHQDPLNPMDSNEFTNQLVQFSQVEQGINTNQKLDSLVGMQMSGMPSFALNYIGKDITYTSPDMYYDGSASVNINFSLGKQAAKSKINIYDEKNNLVYSAELGKEPGLQKFTWNGELTAGGKAKTGTYTAEIAAFDGDNKLIEASTAVTGRVRGVETQNGVVYLLVGERAVALGTIINAEQPAAAPAPAPATDETT